jgi:cellulose-binding protein
VLGAMYHVWGDGRQMVKGDVFDYFGESGKTAEELRAMGYVVWTPPQEKGSFISEGDTPTFMNLLDNGLRAYEDGAYGGWGGRRRPDTGDAPRGRGPAVPPRTALVNGAFFAAAQHDFAARLAWSVTPAFTGANHEPKVSIQGPLAVSARAAATVRLRGEVSDPDRDRVATRWWHYNDAGSYPGDVVIPNPTALDTAVTVPADAKPGQTIHVILEATDQGTPSLTRYQRVIITVE